MPELTMYCAGCHAKVAVLSPGSKVRKGSVMLCENCDFKRKVSDLSENTNSISKLFGDIFRK